MGRDLADALFRLKNCLRHWSRFDACDFCFNVAYSEDESTGRVQILPREHQNTDDQRLVVLTQIFMCVGTIAAGIIRHSPILRIASRTMACKG